MLTVVKGLTVTIAAACVTLLTACGGSNDRPPQESSQVALPLNDTGVSHCGSDVDVFSVAPLVGCDLSHYSAQDAEVGRDFQAASGLLEKQGGGAAGFDFVKLDESGVALVDQHLTWDASNSAALGAQWACVEDKHTGLIWEVKHSSAEHPRYGGNTYSWYSDDMHTNGGESGSQDGGECSEGRCDSAGYIALINAAALCGYDDWRLPTTTEFLTIGHLGRGDPSIDVAYFPNTLGLRHWSAQTYQKTPFLAWYMYFSDGSVSFTGKGDPSYLRLVRGGL